MKKSNIDKKNIVMSVAALVLVLVMAVSFTYSWIEGGNKGYIDGSAIQINSDSSLTMIQAGKNTSSIIIPTCDLQEVSSADGRNFFFPTADNTSSDTSSMTFREGTMGDVNTRYVSLDFELIAGDTATDVYLGAGTIIQCISEITDDMTDEEKDAIRAQNNKVVNALRMAFFTNDGSMLKVFKPTQMPNVDMSYLPITSITPTGVATTTTTATEAYGDYYFKGEESTPLFELEKDESQKITLAIWLEGTEFEGNTIADTDISIFIDFTTTVDDLIKYTFIDNCHNRGDGNLNHWVSNNIENEEVEYDTMMYVFDNTSKRYYALSAVDETPNNTEDAITKWEGYIPKSVSNFYFRRYSIDIDQWWNEWEPTMENIPTTTKVINGVTVSERTFVAIAGQEKSEGTDLDGCYGYWKDAAGTFRIYFEMQTPYSNLHCYAWDTSDKACASTGSWPGKGMTFVKNTSNGVLYCIDLKESENIAGIQFNNGGVTRVYLEGFNYSSNTSAYVHFKDDNNVEKHPLGDWPGTTASYDTNNTVGKYWVDFTTSISNHGRDFYIIANNRSGLQYPAEGGAAGKTGRVYRFTNNNTTLERLAGPYDITGDDLKNKIFNGAAFWLKSDGSHGFYVYTDKDKSLIYPVNDPTP